MGPDKSKIMDDPKIFDFWIAITQPKHVYFS